MKLSRSPGPWLAVALSGALLGACAETQLITHTAKRITRAQEVQPQVTYKVGNPYQIGGVWYYPAEDYAYDERGIASWYGPKFHRRPTANGEIFDMNNLSAAHRTLPMPSFVRVINLENGRSLNLRVNDRGPFVRGRIIDVSRRAAQLLGFERRGTARVRVQILAVESRAVAVALGGGVAPARVDTPITVSRLPTPAVTSETLPPLDGAAVALAPPGKEPRETSGIRVLPAPSVASPAPPPKLGEVFVEPVVRTTLFVQAGAYARYEHANRVRALLARIGGVRVTSVLIAGRDLFRVRIGPLATVADADLTLAQVIAAGHTDARIIVD